MPPQYKHTLVGPALKVDLYTGAIAEGVLAFVINVAVLWIVIQDPCSAFAKMWLISANAVRDYQHQVNELKVFKFEFQHEYPVQYMKYVIINKTGVIPRTSSMKLLISYSALSLLDEKKD
ncbi:aquaporin SIP1-2-like protein [Canna indica]|uniref:Aquaporin SIP1-2-like protein n=1 Tax=Canna indica TaxID=4628 RepID=A0AAQ3KYA8_9LILI|nr:aquaporin SIP1-2-like protein [Canna indica]